MCWSLLTPVDRRSIRDEEMLDPKTFVHLLLGLKKIVETDYLTRPLNSQTLVSHKGRDVVDITRN